jgi:hypothetical protein
VSDPITYPVPKNSALLSPTAAALSDLQASLSANPNFAYLIRHDQDTYAVFKSLPTDADISGANAAMQTTVPAIVPAVYVLPADPTVADITIAVRELMARG